MDSLNEKRLLILGGAGKAGRRLCKQASDAGYHVDAIVRDPQKLDDAAYKSVTVIKGDLADSNLVNTVMGRGYSAVLSTVGIYHKTAATPLSDITSTVIEAMEAHNVRRLVCLSSIGTKETKGQGSFVVRMIARFFLKHVLLDKSAQEAIIKSSGLDWTIIRPPQLIDQDFRQEYQRWEGNRPPAGVSWKISNADAAAEMLRVLELPEAFNKSYQISY